MSTAGLYGVSRRRWVTTTVRDRAAKPAPDKPDRNGDCKFFVPVKTGFAQIIDNFSQQTQKKLSVG
jgi:hypothetical protein